MFGYWDEDLLLRGTVIGQKIWWGNNTQALDNKLENLQPTTMSKTF
jgi:hypothetical protein